MSSRETPVTPPAPGMTGTPAPTLRIQLLGGFEVTVGDRQIADAAWTSRKARQLVALLALAPGQQLTRDQLLDILWPDLVPDAAPTDLRPGGTPHNAA